MEQRQTVWKKEVIKWHSVVVVVVLVVVVVRLKANVFVRYVLDTGSNEVP